MLYEDEEYYIYQYSDSTHHFLPGYQLWRCKLPPITKTMIFTYLCSKLKFQMSSNFLNKIFGFAMKFHAYIAGGIRVARRINITTPIQKESLVSYQFAPKSLRLAEAAHTAQPCDKKPKCAGL